MLLVTVAVWWTIAVIMLSWAFTKVEPDGTLDIAVFICMCVLWPLTAVALVPYAVYNMLVASTKRIRNDLKNRGILREFEQWLKDRDGKIVPKE